MSRRPTALLSQMIVTTQGPLKTADAVEAIRAAKIFDQRYYLDTYQSIDPLLKLIDPISHYLSIGYARGYRPSRTFDGAAYLAHHPEVARRRMNPLLHLALSRAGAERCTLVSGETTSSAANSVPRKSRPRIPDFSRFRRSAPRARHSLDVVIPVYSGFNATLQTIHSVLSSKNTRSFELIVIDDKSPDDDLIHHLKQIASRGLITLIRNGQNLGFAATVNKALSLHPRRDIILLNSDTVVHGDWADRLAAHAVEGVATVTPFSNNASLCSLPRILEANSLPPGVSTRVLDRLCAKLNSGQAVEIPTGIGFCMYVARKAVQATGAFDVKTFGKGYGEDNDFCLRALKKGFRNLHALDVFVFHEGAVSFGTRSAQAAARPLAKLYRKHPKAKAKLRRFAIADPALAARQRIDLSLLARKWSRIDLLIADGTDEIENVLKSRQKKHLVLVVRQQPGNTFRLETLDGLLAAPNLTGLSAERLTDLLGSVLSMRKRMMITFYSKGDPQPSLRHMCRQLGFRWRRS